MLEVCVYVCVGADLHPSHIHSCILVGLWLAALGPCQSFGLAGRLVHWCLEIRLVSRPSFRPSVWVGPDIFSREKMDALEGGVYGIILH